MTYTKHVWVEYAGTGSDKAGWLNNMETQYTEMGTYVDTTYHDSSYYLQADDAKYFNSGYQGAGSGFVSYMLDGYTGDQILAMGINAYTIAVWYSTTGSIPTGWHLCDGRADGYTPDLRDRFLIGAGDTYSVGATGGYKTVTSTASAVVIGSHTLTTDEIPGHSHSFEEWSNPTNTGQGSGSSAAQGQNRGNYTAYTGYTGGGGSHGHTGSTLTGAGTAGNNMPPYKAYCFIIKEP